LFDHSRIESKKREAKKLRSPGRKERRKTSRARVWGMECGGKSHGLGPPYSGMLNGVVMIGTAASLLVTALFIIHIMTAESFHY
jgi:hypothetical protein